ncbi:hypothetical protein Patl1_00765 [Pistacia atlantica]|uniref:Uncharacterized protein n=1 Tax=Pistacia atlantica TaxID=434234 RepID=A0ACC1CCZ5_9ROSI|nr:hypothetical protein Patl1_00765 [Pistacia atlantica]
MHHHPYSELLFNQQNILYIDLFSQLKSPPHVFEAKRLHAILIVRGFFSPTCTDRVLAPQLVNVYVNYGCLREAFLVFDKLPNKSNNIAWNAILRGFIDTGQFSKAIEFYYLMLREGVVPDNFTYPLVLKACSGLNDLEQGKLKLLKQGKEMHNYILKQVFESDVVVGSALIDMYANCGATREAKHVFEVMLDSGINIWNSMIVGYSLNGDLDSAFEIFRRMWDSKIRPNYITLMSILPMCTKVGSVRLGKEIHGYATRSGLGFTVVSVQNSTIDMYCKCGHLELGLKVFNKMREKNIVTYNTIISAYGIHGCGNEAFALFEEMKTARISPNKVTFVSLLSACSHSGVVDKGWFFYNAMINNYHILPDMEHFSCMVDLLGRAGHLHDACNFIRRMPVEPDIDVLGSLLGACKVHNNFELAELVGDLILQKSQKDSGYHVLLSNIYAATDRWNDALKVRTMMKKKCLIKEPGRSWIEIGSCIHMFQARDITHPDFSNIQEILNVLLLEMKDEGYITDSNLFSHDPIIGADELINFNVR